MSGHVIAARELRVTIDKVDVTGITVRPIAGLSLTLTPDPDLDSCFIAQVDAQERLQSKYQEAILDITVHFSDGQSLPLRLVDRSHYSLTVDSRNVSILALTSPVRATIPRVLALNEGLSNLSVVFSSCPTCASDDAALHPLAQAGAVVQVSLTGTLNSPVQNDARTESSQGYSLLSNNQIIADGKGRLIGKTPARGAILQQHQQAGQGQLTFSEPGLAEFGSVGENQLSLRDDSNAVVTIGRGADPPYTSHHPGGSHPIGGTFSNYLQASPLEIGMYVLLAVFCAAIAVFVGTCFVYASRARKCQQPGTPPPPPTVLPRTPVPSRFWNRLKSISREPEEEEGVYDLDQKEEERRDGGWIWLGRSKLETDPASTTEPEAKGLISEGDEKRNSKRMSGISYCGSEVSVRITSRSDGHEGYQAQLCFDQLSNPETRVSSSTFTKNAPVRITTNQLADEPAVLLAKVVRRPKNRRSSRRMSEEQQDTRRYARSWLMAGEAVPRDFNSNPSTLNDVEEPEEDSELNGATEERCEEASCVDQQLDGYNLATFLRHGSPEIKKATIVENPRFSSSSESDGEKNAPAKEEDTGAAGHSENNSAAANNQLSIDYDRIISYLGILKETST